jgi:beta-glucosidase
VGYRHFEKKAIAPGYPFGHGLSYTTFGYSRMKLSQNTIAPDANVTVSINVTNTGKLRGKEIVQLYVHHPKPAVDRPVHELKGFAKVALEPGETRTVNFTVKPRDLSYFEVSGKQWKADAGEYEIQVGESSREILLKAPLTLQATFTEAVPSSKEHR